MGLAIALLLFIPLAGEAQTIQDLLDAHDRRAPSGTTTPGDLTDWNAYNRSGWRAIGKGYFDTAEREFRAAIRVANRPGLQDTRLLARSYADFAWSLQKQGRNAEAEAHARWALVAREALLCPGTPAIAQSQNQLATLYLDLGRQAEAEPLLRRSIEEQGKSDRANPVELARSRTLLGLLLTTQRRYAEAEPNFARALEARERVQGPSNDETADALNNMAWTYLEQGKDDQARPLFDRALKVYFRTRGESSPSVAHVLDGLGQILSRRGEPKEAEANFLRSIAIWEKTPGDEGSLLDVLRHYSKLLDDQGRAEDLGRIKARIAPLRAKLSLAIPAIGPWYRVPDLSPPAGPPSAGRLPG